MSEELLINVAPTESRVALVENGVLQEVYIERPQRRGLVGNIYKGKVVRVLPGMQAAFVNIGLERAGFIHAADIAPLDENGMEARQLEVPDIRNLVHEGQTLVVQVTKDPIGTKGARLTTHLSISSRYLVYMPKTAHIGISTRIEEESERERLKQLVERAITENAGEGRGGFIVRTVAEVATEAEIMADVPFLYQLWDNLNAAIAGAAVPSVLHEDLPLFLRTLRDLVKPNLEKIRVDSREVFGRMTEFAAQYSPERALPRRAATV
jgi:ribonuclease G